MSPYAVEVPQSLAEVEDAILVQLSGEGGKRMTELLKILNTFDSGSVKDAVWHLIDTGRIRLQLDRRLVKAA